MGQLQSKEIRRIVDVNLNRACEGLRVLEDIARFSCNCPNLTGKFKEKRHALRELFSGRIAGSTRARDARGDVGSGPSINEEKRENICSLATNNAKRVEEALRSLEEMSKLHDRYQARRVKEMRFDVYGLEKELHELLSTGKGLRRKGIYLVLPDSSERAVMRLVKSVIDAPIAAIQLRSKSISDTALLRIAKRIRSITQKSDVQFLVNDRVDIALASGADGVHVGREDMPIADIRKITDFSFTIGVSTHSVQEAITSEKDGADYVAFGSIFPTKSKEKAIVQGIGRLKHLADRIKIPVVAIGGITVANAATVSAAGANYIAAISYVAEAKDPKAAVNGLYRAFSKGKKNRTQ